MVPAVVATADSPSQLGWARSGAMALTGHADGPALGVPFPIADAMSTAARWYCNGAQGLGVQLVLDGPALLAERAAFAGLNRNGPTSCGGATRLLRSRRGWVAVALPRQTDVEAVPAWIGSPCDVADPWPVVAHAIATGDLPTLLERARLLGLAVAEFGETVATHRDPLLATHTGERPPRSSLNAVTIVDLSSLWAGPLCSNLLQRAGAHVIKVEASARPDGARLGPPAFFELLHGGKEFRTLDLHVPAGRRELAALLERAEVVIEGSRPRALEQLGIHAEELMRGRGPTVWASITGYGRAAPWRERVAFGDDAGVAAGLLALGGDTPCFVGDAIADPAAGLITAGAVLDALVRGGRWMLDVSLVGAAGYLRNGRTPAEGSTHDVVEVSLPRARPLH